MRSPKNLPLLSVDRADVGAPAPIAQFVAGDASSPGLSLTQILIIARAYLYQIIAIVLTVTLLAAGIIKFMPKTYASKATLMVNYESNDPAEARGIPTGPVATYISTEMELMQSNEVLLPVVDKLNLTKDDYYTEGYRAGGGGNIRDWVKDVLAKDLDIEQGRFGSQLIYITAQARNAALAALIANTVAETYLDQQRQRVFGPAGERARNYSQELAELKQKVSVAQEQVTAFRQRTGVTDSSAQANNVEADLLTSLEQRYQEAQNRRRSAEVAAGGNQNATSAVLGSQLIQNLKTQLDDQNKQLAQMKSTMGPAHPKVIEMENQIATTRRSLAEEVATYSSSASDELTADRQLEQKLAAAVAEQRAKVLAVRKLQDEGTKYVLELESAQSVYKRALDGYDQIMFTSGERYTNVNFVSRAVPALKPTKPNKPKLMLMGVLAGLIIGLGAPFAYELLVNRRVRCRDDYERAFGLPVLIEFDAIEFAPRST